MSKDLDPIETNEWLEAINSVIKEEGVERASFIMTKLAKKFPFYGWERNMGYPTKKHREGIKEHGTTPFHRMSFTLLPV